MMWSHEWVTIAIQLHAYRERHSYIANYSITYIEPKNDYCNCKILCCKSHYESTNYKFDMASLIARNSQDDDNLNPQSNVT